MYFGKSFQFSIPIIYFFLAIVNKKVYNFITKFFRKLTTELEDLKYESEIYNLRLQNQLL